MEENSSYLSLIYAFFNQYLFNDAKVNIKDIKLYFDSNPATVGNPLIENLLGAIKEYDLGSMTYPLFQGILMKTGKTEAEGKQILDEIVKYKQMDKSAIEPARKYLKDIVATVHLRKAEKLYSSSPSEYIKYIKEINFRSTNEDYLNSVSLRDVDINTIVADTNSAYITSSMGFINDSFTEGAYKPGEIIVVSASPSVGKSLFAETEFIHIARVHRVPVMMVVMGDLNMESLILRFATIYSGLTFREAKERLAEIYDVMSKDIGDLLELVVVPAGVITAKEIVDYILDKKRRPAAVCFDYDGNFKLPEGAGDSMYNDYGEMYNEFTRLSAEGIITEVLAQPKVYTWSKEDVIQLADLGTSSRKGHIASVAITISKVPDIPMDLVTFYVAKNRHGINSKAYAIRLNNGKFYTLPKPLWDDMKHYTERREFTTAELDAMVNMFNQSRSNVMKQIDQKMQQGGRDIRGFNKPF